MITHQKPFVFTHLEYPRTLHKPDGSTCTVLNDDDCAAKQAEGWNKFPGDGKGPASLQADVIPPPVTDEEGDPIPLPTPKRKRKA